MNPIKTQLASFFKITPRSTIGAVLALFAAWCLILLGSLKGIIYVIQNLILMIHGKPASYSITAISLTLLVLLPTVGGFFIINLIRRKNWARQWTLGWLLIDAALRILAIFIHTEKFGLGLVDFLLLIALILLLMPESKKWFRNGQLP